MNLKKSRNIKMASLVVVVVAALLSVVVAVAPNFGPNFKPTQADNMNGEYVFSTTPGGKEGLFPKAYKDYPGGVEMYEVYTPAIKTLYSQVWWSPLAPADLPDELVKKYAGKKAVFVGWEIDQVQKTAQGDISVPISASYNHHYGNQLIGAKAKFKKITFDGPEDPRIAELTKLSGHGMVPWDQPHYIVEREDGTMSLGDNQDHIIITSGNGGEYRKTYHGFAPGYGIVVDSPTQLQVTPMQIDTWNRDAMNITGDLPPKFVAGPLPRASEAPAGAEYSGLLECPMTTRLVKQVDGKYLIQKTDTCSSPILTFQECYHAAASSFSGTHNFVNTTGTDSSRPAGCSVSTDPSSPLTINTFFNKANTSTVKCASGSKTLSGFTSSVIDMGVSIMDTTATITLKGPSNVWFGVGFGAQAMLDAPWTIIVDGYGNVSEYKLGNHLAGNQLKPSLTVTSNTVAQGVRTVVVSRPTQGSGPDYYSFNTSAQDASIPVINAVGSGPAYAYHKDKDPSTIVLLPTSEQGACVCPQAPEPFGLATGSLVYHATSQEGDTGEGSVGFRKQKCPVYPQTILNEQRNPTCDIRYYQGGQWACHHMWSLLDADQEIPWPNQTLTFYHKYRFYVQPYNETYHTPVNYGRDTELLIGSPWEYDVPKCGPGVPGCSMENGTWIHTITGSVVGHHNFVSLNFHCHAPTCLSMEVFVCPEGVSTLECNETIGKPMCRQEPVYGGAGNPATKGTRFDETGYIAIPDCFWGDSEFGLEAPPNVTGLALYMVKRCNATYAHYGEMAGGQPFVY
eukprot:m.3773 g.3773  ORF g.3773 m.3773 type:complete len:792 (-) comp2823_c0_seq1:19-2394(-)